MRCAEYQSTPSTPVVYTCGRCQMFYYNHQTLLEHLYWKHGTESDVCKTCQMKKWSFALHKCYHLPYMTTNIGKAIDIKDVEATVVVTVDPSTDPMDDVDTSDSESLTSGDSSYFSERESKYCYCGKDIEGAQMIGCDNENCILEWYHCKCVGIAEVPEGDWYCPECLKLA